MAGELNGGGNEGVRASHWNYPHSSSSVRAFLQLAVECIEPSLRTHPRMVLRPSRTLFVRRGVGPILRFRVANFSSILGYLQIQCTLAQSTVFNDLDSILA